MIARSRNGMRRAAAWLSPLAAASVCVGAAAAEGGGLAGCPLEVSFAIDGVESSLEAFCTPLARGGQLFVLDTLKPGLVCSVQLIGRPDASLCDEVGLAGSVLISSSGPGPVEISLMLSLPLTVAPGAPFDAGASTSLALTAESTAGATLASVEGEPIFTALFDDVPFVEGYEGDSAMIPGAGSATFSALAITGYFGSLSANQSLGLQFRFVLTGDASISIAGAVAIRPPTYPDLNGDGAVDGADLGIVLGQWGGCGQGDCNHDGVVDGADLGLVVSAWMP